MDRALCEPDLFEQCERAIAKIRIADAGRSELRLDVLDGSQRRDQIELLEDEAERAQPKCCELMVRQHGEVAFLEQHATGARPVECAEQLKQRSLPASARPFERDELTGLDLEVDSVECANRRRAALEELRYSVERIERHYSICLSASAGRRRAARSAPAAPAIKPPRRARANPIARTVTPTGALSDTALVAVRTASTPRSEDPPPVLALAVRVGPKALMASAARTPSTIPSTPPAAPWASDSPAICRTTMRCVQPSAFSVPSSRTRFPTDERASSAASRNAAAAATIESTSPR